MRVLMFQPRFQAAVAAGTKCQTIRPKARCQPGDDLSLRKWKDKPYRSLQLPLRETVRCTAVQPVRIFASPWGELGVIVGEKNITDLDAFAKADGFRDANDMRAWFEATHDLPFDGELIKWSTRVDPPA